MPVLRPVRSAPPAAARLAFEDADISIFQILAARPGAPHGLPLLREAVVAPAHAADAIER